MFKPVRIGAALILIGSIILIFIGAFVIENGVRSQLLGFLYDLLTRDYHIGTLHQYVHDH